jgi:hypothetical protein
VLKAVSSRIWNRYQVWRAPARERARWSAQTALGNAGLPVPSKQPRAWPADTPFASEALLERAC